MPPISLLIKPASGLCNMKCDYCFYCDETKKRSQESFGLMSEATLRNVIRKTVLRAEGACTIAFQGGEPTLCGLDFFKKAVEYAAHFNRKGIRIDFALQTNGLAITDEWCEFFAKNHFLIGISIDGLKEIHNTYRHTKAGEDTYERILKTTQLFDKYHVEYNVLTVIHRETAQQIKDIYRHYRENGWDYMQFITCLDPLGEARGQKIYSLLPQMYGQFLIDLFDMWYEDLNRGNAPFVRQFENYIGILLGHMPESCEQRGTCGIQYVVEADGGVYPCDFYVLDEWKLGNFNENRIDDIDAMRKDKGFLNRSRNHPQSCKACRWFALCRGGCYRSRLGEEEPDTGLNYFCEGYKMFFEKCYDRMQAIAKNIAKESQ